MTEAAACYRQALEISPADAAGHNNLGIALQYLGQLEEAVACFRQSIRLSHQWQCSREPGHRISRIRKTS